MLGMMTTTSYDGDDCGGDKKIYNSNTMLTMRSRNPKIVYRKESTQVEMRVYKWAESPIALVDNQI